MIKIEPGHARKTTKGFKGKIQTLFFAFPLIGSEGLNFYKGEIETLHKGDWNGPSIRFRYDENTKI